jgi:alpha-amylase
MKPHPFARSRLPRSKRWGLLAVLAVAAAGPAWAGDPAAPLVSVPRFTHPGAGQVFYFVLTDRFANGSAANDDGGIAGGPERSGFDPTRISHYHGGDFVGLTSKLDYIKGLGVTAIWITPPFRNMAMSRGSAGYHGYWILDFTAIDPHLGTEGEFRTFVEQAHSRGLRVYLDIVINHTADVIHSGDGSEAYVPQAAVPYRDAAGAPFDPHAFAYNGIGEGAFPTLSAAHSFPHVPVVAAGDAHAKGPEWLNDLALYHNRGESSFRGESSTFGDFGGLDDVFTENPRVVRGFIAVYERWMERYHIDGYRIDTVRHVNMEFWQAFAPALRERARALGQPGFLLFGEVADGNQNVELMSAFSTTGTLDATLDFGFYGAARDFVSRGRDAAGLSALFARDDLYTNHDGNAQAETTFVSNHDDGRLGSFLKADNPGASPELLGRLDLLGQELLLTVRGQPVVYYGDEQGMMGLGNDMGAREDMFASRSPRFMALPLLGTTRRGGDDKFDPSHPFYRAIAALARLRSACPGLSRGAMIDRSDGSPHLFAFSRLERAEQVEYLVALNNSRDAAVAAGLATGQRPGAHFREIFNSDEPAGRSGLALPVDAAGRVQVSIAPLQCRVWRAEAALTVSPEAPSIHLLSPTSGSTLAFTSRILDEQALPSRQELRAEVVGGDGFAEVTFVLRRASRPAQSELLGTSDHPPYRVFWRPPADLVPGDTLTFIATVDDLRGHRTSSSADHVQVASNAIEFGIRGATVPLFTRTAAAFVATRRGASLKLEVAARGTGPLQYSWLHDGATVPGADGPILALGPMAPADAGHYTALARNPEGTAISGDTVITLKP